MGDSVLFDGSLSIFVNPRADLKYSNVFYDPLRYNKVTLEVHALHDSSVCDIIDSLIVELEKYKEGLENE